MRRHIAPREREIDGEALRVGLDRPCGQSGLSYIGGEDRSELAGGGHIVSPPGKRRPGRKRARCPTLRGKLTPDTPAGGMTRSPPPTAGGVGSPHIGIPTGQNR